MRTLILVLFTVLVTGNSFAQQKRDLKLNEETKVIEVTYYHDNGAISQKGAYTLDGKIQGQWLGYDTVGNKIVAATYDHGKKVGTWFFWNDDTLNEVAYTENAIAKVTKWNQNTTGTKRQ